MNTNTKRAFSALATASMLTVTVFGIIALMAVPVSAQEIVALSGQTNGQVGQTLTYTARLTNEGTGAPMSGQNIDFTVYNGMKNVVHMSRGTTNPQGLAYDQYTFQQPGSYSVVASYAKNPNEVDHLDVTIAAATPTPTATSAPPTGTASLSGGSSGTGSGGGILPASITLPQFPGLSGQGGAQNPAAAAGESAGVLGVSSSDWAWIIVFIVIILLAIIAIVLLLQRRREEEPYKERRNERQRRRR